MRKCKNFLLIIITIFTVTSCSDKNIEIEKEIELLDKDEIIEEVYVDNNNIPINFYLNKNGYFNKQNDNIYLPWILGKDITVLRIISSTDDNLYGYYLKNIFLEKWHYNNFKIGFNISFKTINSEINCNIITPEDRMKELLDYIIIFLYDDVHPKNPYYHLEQGDINDETFYTSIKIYANDKVNEIISPIKVTVFLYDDEDDFDPITGLYRGNSFKEIYINKSN